MILIDILIFIFGFALIGIGTTFIVGSIDRISRNLGVSSFAISFVILGILTSTPEFAVGLTSVTEGKAEIFVGNLLGASIIIFLLIIPLLAVVGKGVKLDHGLDNYTILFCLLTILAPALLVLDKQVSNEEGVLLIFLYLILLYFVLKKEGILSKDNTKLLAVKSYSILDIFKILGGVALVFISSNLIVDKTLLFAEVLDVSPFFISLLGLAIGTNLPEISIAVRSVAMGKRDIAFGDYLGSAAANSGIFGVLTILNTGGVLTSNRFLITFVFIFVALGLFYFFARSRKVMTRAEGALLLGIYGLFLLFEGLNY